MANRQIAFMAKDWSNFFLKLKFINQNKKMIGSDTVIKTYMGNCNAEMTYMYLFVMKNTHKSTANRSLIGFSHFFN